MRRDEERRGAGETEEKELAATRTFTVHHDIHTFSNAKATWDMGLSSFWECHARWLPEREPKNFCRPVLQLHTQLFNNLNASIV